MSLNHSFYLFFLSQFDGHLHPNLLFGIFNNSNDLKKYFIWNHSHWSKMFGKRTASTFKGKFPLITLYPNQTHQSTILFLHGLGVIKKHLKKQDTGQGWSDEFEYIFQNFRNETKFLFPTAYLHFLF
jgi:hypothetical protein